MEAEYLLIKSDSQLVVNQVTGLYQAKGDNMVAYLAKVQEAIKKFKGVRIEQVPRERNHRTDVLAKIATREGHALPKGVPLQLVPFSSIAKEAEVLPVSSPPCWMDPIADISKVLLSPRIRIKPAGSRG